MKSWKWFGWVYLGISVVWLAIGLFPLGFYNADLAKAGQFGDSFGAATSLLTAVGFILAIQTLMMQIIESRESGERQKSQTEMDSQQIKLLAQQAAITLKTSQLQESIRRDGQRQMVLAILQKTYADSLRFRRAVEDYAAVWFSQSRNHERGAATETLDTAESNLLSNQFAIELQFNSEHLAETIVTLNEIVQLRNKWTSMIGAKSDVFAPKLANLRQRLSDLYHEQAFIPHTHDSLSLPQA